MEVYVSEGKINFKSDKVNSLGVTDYTEELWSKIKNRNWNIKYGVNKNGIKKHPYIYSSHKGKSTDLHRFVMEHWYGKDAMEKAKKEDFIVDHLNNEGLDCQISNLCFIPRTLNTSKGNDYDIRRKEVRYLFGINIVKDFETQLFQITIIFNRPAYIWNKGKRIPISRFYLLYKNNFRRVLIDGNSIMNELLEEGKFNIQKLNCLEFDYDIANYFYCPPEKKNWGYFEVNGSIYVNMDSGYYMFHQTPPKKELFDKYKAK